jgi:RimJ/RimL family protein N-acetyltransferase
MAVLETDRLVLRRLSLDDAEFILRLLNEPSFLRYIGDKGVRNLDDARAYLLNGPIASYTRYGFGLYHTSLKETGEPIGMCGLLKRDALPDVDVGFAFLPKFWRQGYAAESAAAALRHGKSDFGITRVLAITSPDNLGSIRTLEKIGFRFERMIRLTEDSPEINLFVREM